MKAILDLDSIASWHPDFSSLVYAENIWSQVEAKQKSSKVDWLLAALTYAEDRLDDELARYLRRNAVDILITQHNSVTAYHGCRPRDYSSYYKHGILCSNLETLIQEARDIFQDHPGVDWAIQDIGPEYFDHNSGKVYLYYSAYAAKQGEESHVEGSESIRCIAQRLGQQAELQYALTGKPTLIKCEIPIDWIRENKSTSIIGYAGRIIEGLIRDRLWAGKDSIGFLGTYYLTREIPPDNFIEFIDMSSFSNI